MAFFRRARNAIQRVRPSALSAADPEVQTVRGAIARPHVALTTRERLDSSLLRVDSGTLTIIVDPRRQAAPEQSAVDAAIRAIGPTTTVRMWDNAERTDIVGQSIWCRVTVSSATTLESVIVPRELIDAESVVLVSQPRSHEAVVRTWTQLSHSTSAMRARLAGNGAEADLALAVPATYVIALDHVQQDAIAVANGPLAAELIALAAWRLVERQRGIEAEGPWEDARVQRLIEATIGAGVAATLSLDLLLPDNAPRVWTSDLASELGHRSGDVAGLSITGDDREG